MLELTEEELTAIWGVLVVVNLNPGRCSEAFEGVESKADEVLKTALYKVSRLMEGE